MPPYPTYFCMPAKKCILCPFLFQLLMIAGAPWFPLGPRNAHLKNRPDVHGGCQPQFFDAAAHFVCRPQESEPNATGGPHTPASQLSGPFSCTCPLLPCVWVCSPTPGQEAIRASAPLLLNSERLTELWWHLMREVQGF